MSSPRRFSFVAAAGTLAALTGVSVAVAAGAERAAARGCVPAPGQVEAVKVNNIEAILDDSASMRHSDPNSLRVAGLELFVKDPDNAPKTLGAVEFGNAGSTVFLPQNVGLNRDFMIDRLRARLIGDYGDTYYDAGFIKAQEDNPGAEARIFVTDGAPDEGGFNNTHRGGPRTFVVGLGIGRPGPNNTNANRLQRIADETGGVYFPDVAAATLQPTYRTISAAINCLSPPRQFKSRLFWQKGQKSTRTVRLDPSTTRLELALNWAHPRNRFAFTRVDLLGPRKLGRRKRVLATLSGRGRPRKLTTRNARAKTSRSRTFNKPRAATRLRFTVTAKKIVRPSSTITLLIER